MRLCPLCDEQLLDFQRTEDLSMEDENSEWDNYEVHSDCVDEGIVSGVVIRNDDEGDDE